VSDVRRALKALAEKALQPPSGSAADLGREAPGTGEGRDRLADALSALRLLVEHWDELIRSQPSMGNAAITTPSGTPPGGLGTRMGPFGTPRPGTPRPGTPRITSRRPDEAHLLSLLADHRVSLRRARDVPALLFPCRSCGEDFEPKDEVLVALRGGPEPEKPHAATHLRCRWWWWESPHSPIHPKIHPKG
jgi:hypothetical protein